MTKIGTRVNRDNVVLRTAVAAQRAKHEVVSVAISAGCMCEVELFLLYTLSFKNSMCLK